MRREVVGTPSRFASISANPAPMKNATVGVMLRASPSTPAPA